MHFTQNEFKIIELLAIHAGKVLTYDFILEQALISRTQKMDRPPLAEGGAVCPHAGERASAQERDGLRQPAGGASGCETANRPSSSFPAVIRPSRVRPSVPVSAWRETTGSMAVDALKVRSAPGKGVTVTMARRIARRAGR